MSWVRGAGLGFLPRGWFYIYLFTQSIQCIWIRKLLLRRGSILRSIVFLFLMFSTYSCSCRSFICNYGAKTNVYKSANSYKCAKSFTEQKSKNIAALNRDIKAQNVVDPDPNRMRILLWIRICMYNPNAAYSRGSIFALSQCCQFTRIRISIIPMLQIHTYISVFVWSQCCEFM